MLILLIFLQIFYVCFYSCRLNRKIKEEDYDDLEFVVYKLQLSNTEEIKGWMKRCGKQDLQEKSKNMTLEMS
jgi:hypothetical protein